MKKFSDFPRSNPIATVWLKAFCWTSARQTQWTVITCMIWLMASNKRKSTKQFRASESLIEIFRTTVGIRIFNYAIPDKLLHAQKEAINIFRDRSIGLLKMNFVCLTNLTKRTVLRKRNLKHWKCFHKQVGTGFDSLQLVAPSSRDSRELSS